MPFLKKWFLSGTDPVSGLPVPGGGGSEFTNAFVTTPLCCPSRASILTGQYPHNHQVTTDDADYFPAPPGDPGCTSVVNATSSCYDDFHGSELQSKLKAVGYRTGIVGKYLNSWPICPPGYSACPVRRPPGFDWYTIWSNGKHQGGTGTSSNCVTHATDAKEGVNCVDHNGSFDSPNMYETQYALAKVKEFLNTAGAQPWFLYVTPTVPHAPFAVESTYAGPTITHAGRTMTVPPFSDPTPGYFEPRSELNDMPSYVGANYDNDVLNFNGNNCHPQPVGGTGPTAYKQCVLLHRDKQYRMLLSVDDMVDNIMTELNNRGLANNTLAIYISDNGYLWGQHWLEGKPYPYNGDAQVPMFMRWPDAAIHNGNVQKNVYDPRLVANIDFAPTALGAVCANLVPPATCPAWNSVMDGRNLVGSYFRSLRSDLMIERYGRNTFDIPLWASLRSAPWLSPYYEYNENYGSQSRLDPDTMTPTEWEYYDLGASPSNPEATNSYSTLPQTTKDNLHNTLHNYLKCSGPQSRPIPGGCP